MPEDSVTQQPMSDDQELAKVLAGVSQDANDVGAATIAPIEPVAQPEPVAVEPQYQVTDADNLDGIKKEALLELRPLVDKLDVSPEEKFDTYLLLLRSTDDKELIAPAHESAKSIVDESRRAQALLDIIKEIDFLSQAQK